MLLSNYQLVSICRNHNHTHDVLDGIYSLDLIPSHVTTFPSFWICNNEKSGEKGEHWFALYFESSQMPSEFFCSLGRGPEEYSPQVVKALKLNGNGQYKRNIHKYQAPTSQTCGYFCLWFTDLRCQKISFENCLTILSPSELESNGEFVVNYVTRHMRPNV